MDENQEVLKCGYELLERTGHSYSGIADIVHNEPELTKKLIAQIDDRYHKTIEIQERLENELELIKKERAFIVSDFCHLHNALNLNEKPLSFLIADTYTNIEMLGNYKIDYNKFIITFCDRDSDKI